MVFSSVSDRIANGREYFYGGKLYYINPSGIYCTNDRAETVLYGVCRECRAGKGGKKKEAAE